MSAIKTLGPGHSDLAFLHNTYDAAIERYGPFSTVGMACDAVIGVGADHNGIGLEIRDMLGLQQLVIASVQMDIPLARDFAFVPLELAQKQDFLEPAIQRELPRNSIIAVFAVMDFERAAREMGKIAPGFRNLTAADLRESMGREAKKIGGHSDLQDIKTSPLETPTAWRQAALELNAPAIFTFGAFCHINHTRFTGQEDGESFQLAAKRPIQYPGDSDDTLPEYMTQYMNVILPRATVNRLYNHYRQCEPSV